MNNIDIDISHINQNKKVTIVQNVIVLTDLI